MTPEQIAEAVLASRFPTTHPGTAFYQNARTMIVDGIERALAERDAEQARGDIDPIPFADTCCGRCPGATCYVDQMTGERS